MATASRAVHEAPLLTDSPTPSISQREAIEAPPGPLLVLAGPGAGKTFCLIERIRFLIEQRGIAPARICAFTFTNKAADEIAHRLERTLGEYAAPVRSGTLHAFCAQLLREHGTSVGLAAGIRHCRRGLSARRAASPRGTPAVASHAAHAFQRQSLSRCAAPARRHRAPRPVRALPREAEDGGLRHARPQDGRAARAHAGGRRDSLPLGRHPRRRVSGPESRAVSRDPRARARSRAPLRGRRPRAVHLLVGRRRSRPSSRACSTTSGSRGRFDWKRIAAARAMSSRWRGGSSR